MVVTLGTTGLGGAPRLLSPKPRLRRPADQVPLVLVGAYRPVSDPQTLVGRAGKGPRATDPTTAHTRALHLGKVAGQAAP